MRPLLFEIFGIPFPSWGVFFSLGFIAAFIVGYYEAKRIGLDGEKALDVGFWMTVGAILGSRILFVIVEWDFFKTDIWEAFRIWNGGMILYGGLFGSIVGAYIAAQVMSVPKGKIADVIALVAPLGLLFGRIGCLLNGCCFGRPAADSAWAITYTRHDCMANMFLGRPLYAAPIYEIALLALIFIALVVLSRRKKFDWQVFWAFYIMYPLARFTVEIFRGDPRGWVNEPILSKVFGFLMHSQTFSDYRGNFFHEPYLSTSQFLSVIIFIAAVAGYVLTEHGARRRMEIPEGDLRSLKEHGKD